MSKSVPVQDLLADPKFGKLRRALVLTALPLEMKEVRRHLEPLVSCPSPNGNFFEVGVFSGSGEDWLVAVGETTAGNIPASLTTVAACQMFGPVELIIFVGVAGTRKPDDVEIGSVVAASHVCQAGSGKHHPQGFDGRARVYRIPDKLRNYCAKIVRDGEWQSRIKVCDGITVESIEYPKPFPPTAVVGAMVSTEAVSANEKSSLEREIGQVYSDTVAVEMEGYGVIAAANDQNIPATVIRGISDARKGKKSKKDKIIQPIAASHAAAFAFELLSFWSQNVATGDAPPPTPTAKVKSLLNVTAYANTSSTAPIKLVLTFNGTASEFSKEKQDEIVGAIKKELGISSVKNVGSASGSFHLFIEVAAEDLSKIWTANLKNILQRKMSVDFVCIRTWQEFESAILWKRSLVEASHSVINWRNSLPDGTVMERPELSRLLNTIDTQESSTVALLGLPGSGKTSLLSSLARVLDKKEVTFLAIKADLLPSSVATEENLQTTLKLPRLPSELIRLNSYTGKVVLIIDQLDALAGYVDLHTDRLSVLLNLVRAVSTLKNVHVILSARTFEFEHDVRLKSVNCESVSLDLPPWGTVEKVLKTHDVDASGWPLDAREELRSPQSLSIFLQLENGTNKSPADRYQTMLERLWQERILSRPNSVEVSRLAFRIAEDMAEFESFWLGRARYEDQAEQLSALISTGLIVDDGPRISFSHQTVFEFVLARAFVKDTGSLSAYILDRQNSLFVRPKAWAALTYLRAADTPGYLSELSSLWQADTLRLHLRHLLIEFLGQQPSPLEVEAQLLDKSLAGDETPIILHAIIGNKSYFQRYQGTVIPKQMQEGKNLNLLAGILARALPSFPAEVATLMARYWGNKPDMQGLAWSILTESTHWGIEEQNLGELLASSKSIPGPTFDHGISAIGAHNAEVAISLASTRLSAQLEEAVTEAIRLAESEEQNSEDIAVRYSFGPVQPIIQVAEKNDAWDSLEALAQLNASFYLKAIWEWFVRLLNATAQFPRYNRDAGYKLPWYLDYRFDDEGSSDLPEHPILGSLRSAVEVLATDADKTNFLEWYKQAEQLDFMPAQRLVAHALAIGAERHSSLALDFLLGDSRRLELGGIEDAAGTTKRLIQAASPHWSKEQLSLFLASASKYVRLIDPELPPESRRRLLQDVDRLRLELFSEIPAKRLPDDIVKYCEEQKRRFGVFTRGVSRSGFMSVGSPISADAFGKAKDEDILNAFSEVPTASGWEHPKHWLKGGNIQMSREFAEFAKKNPIRAAVLLEKLDPATGDRAVGYALDAMAETADPALISRLIQSFEVKGFSSDEYRSSVARSVERLVRREADVPEFVINILKSWLQADPEDDGLDENEDLKTSLDLASSPERLDSILWGMRGFAVLPSGNYPILDALTRFYLQAKRADDLVALLRAQLQISADIRVWNALIRFFHYIPSKTSGLKEFINEVYVRFPDLLFTRETALLVAHTYVSNEPFAIETLKNWSANSSPLVQQAFGEVSTLVYLMRPDFVWAKSYIENVFTSSSSYALAGMAYASSYIWAEDPLRTIACDLLEKVIESGDAVAWPATVDLFRLVDEIIPSDEWIRLLGAFAIAIPVQRSFPSSFIIERLQTLLPHQPLLIADIAQKLVDIWLQDLSDMRTHAFADAAELVDLAITVHRLSPSSRDAGLVLFEKLLQANAYTARDTLSEIDNRFSSSAQVNRPRLPRRQHRRRKPRATKAK